MAKDFSPAASDTTPEDGSIALDLDGGTQDHSGKPVGLDVKPPFFYVWHKQAWQVQGGKLVPRLRAIRIVPGVNHIEPSTKDGKPQVTDALAHLTKKGWHLIPYKLGPNGSYMKVVETINPETMKVDKTYMSKWEQVYAGSGRVGTDTKGYVAWLRKLVSDRVIPDCPVNVAEELLANARKDLDSYENLKAQGKTAYGRNIADLKAAIKVLDAYCGEAAKPAVEEDASLEFDVSKDGE